MTTTPDPRPQVVRSEDGTFHLIGSRCRSCGHPMLALPPRCASCLEPHVADATFGASGTVWSSTVVRIAVPGRTPPYALAYVDIDEGPRVLAHVIGHDERVAVGQRVRLVSSSAAGDLTVQVLS